MAEHSEPRGREQRSGHAVAGEQQLEFAGDALTRDPGETRCRAREGTLALGGQAQRRPGRGEAEAAQHAQRVVVKVGLPDYPDPAGGEVVEPADQVEQRSARQSPEQGVDREVAAPHVGLDAAALQRNDVDLSPLGDKAPGDARRPPEREAAHAEAAGDCDRASARVAVDDQVEVVGIVTEQAIAQRAAGQEHQGAGHRVGDQPEQAGAGQPAHLLDGAHRQAPPVGRKPRGLERGAPCTVGA
jgi:hypothetical protein